MSPELPAEHAGPAWHRGRGEEGGSPGTVESKTGVTVCSMCFKKTPPLQGCRRCGDGRLLLNPKINKKNYTHSGGTSLVIYSCRLQGAADSFLFETLLLSSPQTIYQKKEIQWHSMGNFLKCSTRHGHMTGRHWGQRVTRGRYQLRLFPGFTVVMCVTDWLQKERGKSTFLFGTGIIRLSINSAL